VVKPTQITASDRWSIGLYPCKVNPRYTEEGRPPKNPRKSNARSTPTRRFPSFPTLGKDATVLSTRLLERPHTAHPGSHLHYWEQTGRRISRVVAIKFPHWFIRYKAYRSHSRQALGTLNSLDQHHATRSRPNPLLLPHERVNITNLWFQHKHPISREQWVITRLLPYP
jgi:hypothetical protein